MLALDNSQRPRAASASLPSELDELTLARAMKRDEVACRALFRHYKDKVFAFLWRMLRCRATQAEIEELLQETFLRVFRGLPQFSPTGSARLSTWILTIATRVARSALRRRRPSGLPMNEILSTPASEDRTDDYAKARELSALLVRAIEQMQPEYRAVFLLREYHELSYDEIAAALDVAVGTVRSRLSRARLGLRGALEEVDHVS